MFNYRHCTLEEFSEKIKKSSNDDLLRIKEAIVYGLKCLWNAYDDRKYYEKWVILKQYLEEKWLEETIL